MVIFIKIILLGFLGYLLLPWAVSLDINISLNDAIWAAIISSSLTAILTIVPKGILERRSRKYENYRGRWKAHYQTLVLLEHERIELGAILTDNIHLMKNFLDATRKGGIIFPTLRPLPRSIDVLKNLLDIELVNNLYTHYDDVRKLNDDVESFSENLKVWRQMLINSQNREEGRDFYLARAKELAESALPTIIKFGYKLRGDSIRFSAILRRRIENDVKFFELSNKQLIDMVQPLSTKEVEKEEGIIMGEVEEATKKRMGELKKIFPEYKKPSFD